MTCQASAVGRRPDPRRGHRDPRRRRPVPAGAAGPRGQEAAHAARPHHHHDVLRELHPHPGVVRGGRQVDERRRDQRQRLGILGGQGRVAARHRADPAGRRRRRADHPASGVRCGPAAGGVDAGAGRQRTPRDQRRRRHPRTPHPGTAGRADHPAAPRRHRGPPGGHRRRRPAQPGGPVQRRPAQHPGCRGGAGRAAHPAAGRGRPTGAVRRSRTIWTPNCPPPTR